MYHVQYSTDFYFDGVKHHQLMIHMSKFHKTSQDCSEKVILFARGFNVSKVILLGGIRRGKKPGRVATFTIKTGKW